MNRGLLAAAILMAAVLTVRAQELSEDEQLHLRMALREAQGSAVDLMRALESHLEKYPESPRKSELERAIAKAAIQAGDQKRIASYGERALLKDASDITLLEAVARALVAQGQSEKAKAGLEWSRRLEAAIRESANEMPASGADLGRQKDEFDRLLGRSLLYQAIAIGTMGDHRAAAELARRSFKTYPSGEPAAELAKRLATLGRTEEAVHAYADAFTIPDPQARDADRAAIRTRMGELYQKWKGSETGLGDIVLQAYDRTAALIADRKLALRQFDPNLGVTNPMQFTLSGVDGSKLALSSLLGKVVVMDFWATWCGPCRVQHPLYEKVKERFKGRDDVVFLAINTDEDREMVKPFLDEVGWGNTGYFEDGLSRTLRVSSIPTTVVFGKRGTVASRMNGFDPSRFVDMLTERINDALAAGEPAKAGE
jgi:thiol-disulfide isomerase/thioredoxin